MMRLSSPTSRTTRTRLPLPCSARRSEACLVRRSFVNAHPQKGFSLTAMWKINFSKISLGYFELYFEDRHHHTKARLKELHTGQLARFLPTTSRSSDPQNRYRHRVIVSKLASYYKGSVRTRCGWFSRFATHRFFFCVCENSIGQQGASWHL